MSRLIHNEQLKQINWLDVRYYQRSEDLYFPSVTTILSAFPKGEFFYSWLKENGDKADEILKTAGESGTKVHEATELYDDGFEVTWADQYGKPKYSLEEWQMILKYVDFVTVFQPEILARELKIFSDKYQYAGTVDLLCRINGQVYLLDIKTSNGVYPTYHLQTAAYAVAVNEKFEHIKVDRTGVLWLKAKTRGQDKSGKKIQGHGYQVIESDNDDYLTDFDAFMNVYAVYKIANPVSKPYNVILPDRVQLPKDKIKINTKLSA